MAQLYLYLVSNAKRVVPPGQTLGFSNTKPIIRSFDLHTVDPLIVSSPDRLHPRITLSLSVPLSLHPLTRGIRSPVLRSFGVSSNSVGTR